MREEKRRLELRRLDVELRSYRRAGMEKNPTSGLLRAVRQALRVPVDEIAEKMGVDKSYVFRLEVNERSSRISLSSMSWMADAMGCKVVYGIVPKGGKTLDQLAELRLWAKVLQAEKERVAGDSEKGLRDLQIIRLVSGTLDSDTLNKDESGTEGRR